MKQSAARSALVRLAQFIVFGGAVTALPALALDTAGAAATGNASSAAKVAAASAAAHAPDIGNAAAAASTGSGSLTMLFGLAAVLALIAGIAWLLKRSGLTPAMQSSAAARIVGGVSVGNRERVVVVEVADQWIVVGVAPGSVTALATMPRQDTLPTGAAPAAKNFSSWMKQTIEKRNAPR
jgi:flagellar protein FliO/FliZ